MDQTDERTVVTRKLGPVWTAKADMLRELAPITGSRANRLIAKWLNFKQRIYLSLKISRYYYVAYYLPSHGMAAKAFGGTGGADPVMFQISIAQDLGIKCACCLPTVMSWQEIGPGAYFELKRHNSDVKRIISGPEVVH